MEQPKVQSKADKFSRLIYVVAAFFFGSIGFFISHEAIKKDPIELATLLFSFVFWFFALWGFIGIWIYFDTIKIFSDRIEVSNWAGLFRRKIYFNDIKNIEVEVRINKYSTFEQCVINVKQGRRYKLYDKSYKNYLDLKRNLEQKKIKNLYKNDRKTIEKKTLIVLFICFLIFAPFYFIYESVYSTIERSSLIEIPLTLDKKPQIRKKRKGGYYLFIDIKEYPKFNFNMSGVAFSASDRSNFVENTEGGNKIYFLFDKEAYQQKLSKEKEVTFWNKYFSYYRIDVYGIRDDKITYLTLEDYITESKSSNNSAILWSLVFVFFVSFSMRNDIKEALSKKVKRRKY